MPRGQRASLDTRFLGVLYQDLSEAARKRFALLQTPDFVEEFILDRTLEPATAELGLERVRMIDPTCGSGHFLLGGFHRLLGRWRTREPGTNPAVLVQRALDGVYGVDLKPFAVAIARFRLTVAALRACGLTRLKDAPGFTTHLGWGDSLLHGRRHGSGVRDTASERAGFVGLITTNSFMKREFGKKLIEQIIPCLDLTHVLDTSGAYIPGHGTPTVILFGRNRAPVSGSVRAALGIRGEPETPDNPENGLVWGFLVSMLDSPGAQNSFLTIADVARNTYHHHPWNLGGGGALELKSIIEEASPRRLTEVVELVGVLGMTNADDVMIADQSAFRRKRVEPAYMSEGARRSKTAWEDRIEHDGTKLQHFPVPPAYHSTLDLARRLDRLGQQVAAAESHLKDDLPLTRAEIDRRRLEHEQCIGRMVALQEELDWLCYRLYGDLEVELVVLSLDELPLLRPGQRAFEFAMAREGRDPSWFERHGSTPSPTLPADWPAEYQHLVERRIRATAADPQLALLEQPQHKRRWQLEAWPSMEERVLKTWLLDRLEASRYWPEPALTSCAALADAARRDGDFMAVAALYRGREDFDVTTLVTELAVAEAVPYLPRVRYTASGLEKRKQWEDTWALQRREDAGEKLASPIPVPPKYANGDFQKGDHWRLRGKRDVPKERFIVYPGAEREADPTPVLGWAGWDHLQQAQALAAGFIHAKDDEGWPVGRLRPLLEGLRELLPWLLQWHDDLDPDLGERMGTFYHAFITDQARTLGLPLESL